MLDSKTLLFSALCFSSAIPAAATAANAAPYPSKPISLIVSYPAGGSVDVTARVLQEPLSKALGQSVVIENKGGAGGTIGSNYVAKAQPDGYTVLITLSSHTINPAIYSKLPFDTQTDFAPVSLVASAPQILVANPSFPVSTLPELLEYVKKSPNPVPYGSAGVGSPSHIAGALLTQRTDLKFTHVAYRGGGPAVIDVLGGQIPLLWVSLPSVTMHIKEGRLKPIAVSTRERTPVLPDVPAVAETVKDFNVDSWYAMFVPKGTPQPVVDKIQGAVAAATRDEKVKAALLIQGATAVGGTAAELDDIVRTEIPQWQKLAREANIKID